MLYILGKEGIIMSILQDVKQMKKKKVIGFEHEKRRW